jgi:exoribonuclease R
MSDRKVQQQKAKNQSQDLLFYRRREGRRTSGPHKFPKNSRSPEESISKNTTENSQNPVSVSPQSSPMFFVPKSSLATSTSGPSASSTKKKTKNTESSQKRGKNYESHNDDGSDVHRVTNVTPRQKQIQPTSSENEPKTVQQAKSGVRKRTERSEGLNQFKENSQVGESTKRDTDATTTIAISSEIRQKTKAFSFASQTKISFSSQGNGHKSANKKLPLFESYWNYNEVQEKLQNGTLRRGQFRVNPFRRHEAYADVGLQEDVLIEGNNQNRAFDGDIVAVLIFPESEWKPIKDSDNDNLSTSPILLNEEDVGGDALVNENINPTPDDDLEQFSFEDVEVPIEEIRETIESVDISEHAQTKTPTEETTEETTLLKSASDNTATTLSSTPSLPLSSSPSPTLNPIVTLSPIRTSTPPETTKTDTATTIFCSPPHFEDTLTPSSKENDEIVDNNSRNESDEEINLLLNNCAPFDDTATTTATTTANDSHNNNNNNNSINRNQSDMWEDAESVVAKSVEVASPTLPPVKTISEPPEQRVATQIQSDSQREVLESSSQQQSASSLSTSIDHTIHLQLISSQHQEFSSSHQSTNNVANQSSVKAEVPTTEPKNSLQSVSQQLAVPQKLRPTGKVVYILERKHLFREFVGFLKPFSANGPKPTDKMCFFVPIDKRVPKFLLFTDKLPNEITKNWQLYTTTYFIAKFKSWSPMFKFPLGTLLRKIDRFGTIESETTALLSENGIDTKEFPSHLLERIPNKVVIAPKERKCRLDLRNERIFTIDPKNARDLDDALSCTELSNGNFQVGVHIADVSYYVKANTLLDRIAKSRSTSVYLVQKCIPMLPQILSENLCSLNPKEERLTFSVIWEITPDGEIVNEWFGKTIIRSCCRFTYDDVQMLIESQGLQTVPFAPLPMGSDGDEMQREMRNLKTLQTLYHFTTLNPEVAPHLLAQDIINLHKLAIVLRKKRVESGALTFPDLKLQFELDENGLPKSFSHFVQKDSNILVEEWMLLANIAVAKKIYTTFPNMSFLRRHLPPYERKINRLNEYYKRVGIDLKISGTSSKELCNFLEQSATTYAHIPNIRRIMEQLLLKAMRSAEYFTSGFGNKADFHHYALNVPFYTHFTSPIRRYADIVVHRLLEAALALANNRNFPMEVPLEPSALAEIAENCNSKKLAAKKAQEQSEHLFLCFYLKKHPVVENSIVLEVTPKVITVFSINLGVETRFFVDDFKKLNLSTEWLKDKKALKVVTQSQKEFIISHFSQLQVEYTCTDTCPLNVRGKLNVPTE